MWLRADRQTGGKGRLGRKWESPLGNLYCSGLVQVRETDPPPASLSFLAGLAVYETIAHYLPNAEMYLKWPNDILLSGAKICGILLESVEDKVIVGIGVNIKVTPNVEGRQVTSLFEHGVESSLDSAAFLSLLAQNFSALLKEWRQQGLDNILRIWQERAHPIGTVLATKDETGAVVEGEYAGLSDDGALRLRKDDGTLIEIHAGDVNLV